MGDFRHLVLYSFPYAANENSSSTDYAIHARKGGGSPSSYSLSHPPTSWRSLATLGQAQSLLWNSRKSRSSRRGCCCHQSCRDHNQALPRNRCRLQRCTWWALLQRQVRHARRLRSEPSRPHKQRNDAAFRRYTSSFLHSYPTSDTTYMTHLLNHFLVSDDATAIQFTVRYRTLAEHSKNGHTGS